jgi:hypothetical protein
VVLGKMQRERHHRCHHCPLFTSHRRSMCTTPEVKT